MVTFLVEFRWQQDLLYALVVKTPPRLRDLRVPHRSFPHTLDCFQSVSDSDYNSFGFDGGFESRRLMLQHIGHLVREIG